VAISLEDNGWGWLQLKSCRYAMALHVDVTAPQRKITWRMATTSSKTEETGLISWCSSPQEPMTLPPSPILKARLRFTMKSLRTLRAWPAAAKETVVPGRLVAHERVFASEDEKLSPTVARKALVPFAVPFAAAFACRKFLPLLLVVDLGWTHTNFGVDLTVHSPRSEYHRRGL